jgi:glycogen(starch) synthase
MRIMMLSNFYPPHVLGGYELGCRDVVNALMSRQHDVTVLTSMYGVDRPTVEGSVYRLLPIDRLDVVDEVRSGREFAHLSRLQIRAQRAFDRVWTQHKPDIVHVWNMARLPLALAYRAQERGPVAYFVSDPWLAQSEEPGWYQERWLVSARRAESLRSRAAVAAARLLFRLAGLTWPDGRLRLEHAQFCSHFLRNAAIEAGLPVHDAEVVHWGIDLARFPMRDPSASERSTRLLYVGQVVPHKGVHTAIAALGLLHEQGYRDVTLTIVGATHDASYAARLHAQIAAFGLAAAVRFLPPQPRERISDIYRQHHVLVFTSCWDEPFAITPLEAMASGLVIVGTRAGGSREIFEHGINALTFLEQDARACATQLARLIDDSSLGQALAVRGRQTIADCFTLDRMVDRIESRLKLAAAGPQHAH